MESSEGNPPPSSESPPVEQPATEAPSEVQTEGEPAAAQHETQAADGSAEKPEVEKIEGEPIVVQESQEGAGDAATIEKPEGETAVTESAIEGEQMSGQQQGETTAVEPVGEENSDGASEVSRVMSQIDILSEQTNEEFASCLVNTVISQAIERVSEESFIASILNKIVDHAVGEESHEESEEEVPEVHAVEVYGEDVMTQLLKYLLGPESLRLEEERWPPEFPPTCLNFLNVVEFSRRFVDDIIEKAIEVCLLRYNVEVKYRKKQVEVQNIRWPSIENFTIDLGMKKIDEYIQMTFEVEENWLYKINFIAAQSDLSSDVYLYEVVFCIPTPCYPIAQATVSIYFSCDVSRVKPPECPIDVTYSIESLKEVLVPGRTTVNDDMLLRLIYSKLSVFKSLYF